MIVIEGHGYRVGVSAEHGGTVVFAEAEIEGRPLPIFVPLTTPEMSKNGGSFVMAPFTNRIAGGRFVFDGRTCSFPMNRPEQDVAIHGFSRDRAWRVIEQGSCHVVLEDAFQEAGIPWRYVLTQTVSVDESGLAIHLSVENRGDAVMPFGIGLHPWFPREAGTRLTIPATGRYTLDARALPCLPFRPQNVSDRTRTTDAWMGVDETLMQADVARVEWPSRRIRLDMTTSGAFRHLHLFVPPARDVFCIEPVSHLPDAVNRPELGADAAMTALAPEERLEGKAVFRMTAM